MALLPNVGVLCRSTKQPIALWSMSQGVTPQATLKNTRQAVSVARLSPRVGSLAAPFLFPSNVGAATREIRGVVVREGTYDHRKVRLYHRATGMLVRELISEINGTFSVPNLDKDTEFVVVALDENDAFNAAVIDKVLPHF